MCGNTKSGLITKFTYVKWICIWFICHIMEWLQMFRDSVHGLPGHISHTQHCQCGNTCVYFHTQQQKKAKKLYNLEHKFGLNCWIYFNDKSQCSLFSKRPGCQSMFCADHLIEYLTRLFVLAASRGQIMNTPSAIWYQAYCVWTSRRVPATWLIVILA